MFKNTFLVGLLLVSGIFAQASSTLVSAGSEATYVYSSGRTFGNIYGLLGVSETGHSLRPTQHPSTAVSVGCQVEYKGALNYEGATVAAAAVFYHVDGSKIINSVPVQFITLYRQDKANQSAIDFCQNLSLQIKNSSRVQIDLAADQKTRVLVLDSGTYSF